MAFLDRLWRLIRANLNSLISQAEDPEKILEQAVMDMQNDFIQLRQAVAQAIATQKRTERQASQAETNAEEWYRRAQLALQKGDELLAREALSRRNSFQETATALRAQIEQQQAVVEKLKENMRVLESKLGEAKTKRDMYIARARSAKASQQLNEMLGRVGTKDAMTAFERMEERVMQMEARAEATAELNSGDAIEKQFRALESGGDVDAELSAMKAQLLEGSSATRPAIGSAADSALDAELEELKAKLEDA